MLSDTITLSDADEVIDLAESVVLALREFRDSTSDEAWDKLFDNEKLGALLDACTLTLEGLAASNAAD